MSNDESELLFVKTDKNEHLYILHNINSQKQVIKKEVKGKDKASKLRGNPLFDIFFMSFKKFGPHSSFIGCPSTSTLSLISRLPQPQNLLLEDYFNSLSLKKYSLETRFSTLSLPCRRFASSRHKVRPSIVHSSPRWMPLRN